MNESPFAIVSAIAGATTVLTGVVTLASHIRNSRRERKNRLWTEQMEENIRAAGGTAVQFPVFQRDRVALMWAINQRRLRVVAPHPWGWMVELETRLLSPSGSP